jgi:hypothetical protein
MTEFEAWRKESFEIAVKIAWQNGAFGGTPKGGRSDLCRRYGCSSFAARSRSYAGTIQSGGLLSRATGYVMLETALRLKENLDACVCGVILPLPQLS